MEDMKHEIDDQDDQYELKKQLARDGPKIEKELDAPNKVMVNGIPKRADFTDEQLRREFEVFGPVRQVNIIRKKSSNIPRGFAFVTFVDEEGIHAAEAIKKLTGKDLGGEAPLHCARAVIGFIRQSQHLSSQKRAGFSGRVLQGRGRGFGRGMDRGRGRGMERGRGGPPRGGRGGPPRGGRGGGPGAEYYPYQEEFYGGEYYEEEGGFGGYPERGGRGAPRGPRGAGMPRGRGAPPPGMRGRGGPGGPPLQRGRGFPERGGPMKRPLLPSPPMARGRGGGHPHAPPQEEYYPEEGYGEEYAGTEEYYEEDPYAAGGYGEQGYGGEEELYGADGGYYGVPEAPPRQAPPRGRGGPAAPPAAAQRGRGAPGSYRGNGPVQRRGGPAGVAPRGGGGRGGPPSAGPEAGARRQPKFDAHGYPIEEPVGAPPGRQRPPQQHNVPTYEEDYYGEPEIKEHYPPQRPAGPSSRSRAPADPYGEDPYAMYAAGDASHRGMYEEEAFEDPYAVAAAAAGPAPGARRPAATAGGAPSARPQAPSRPPRQAPDAGRYGEVSDYVGQGASGDGRRAAAHPRRDDPYMGQRAATEQDGYMSYGSSRMAPESREAARKRPMEGYDREYDEYRGLGRERRERDPMGRDPMGRDPMGRDPMGRDPMGRDAMGRDPMGRDAMGRDPMGRDPMGRDPMGRDPMGRDAMGREQMGREPSSRDGMGRDPMSREQMSRDAMARKRPMDEYRGREQEYDEYRGMGHKRERVDRSMYEAYASRQEGAYRRL